MPNLSGSFEAPELAGPTFRGAWGGQSVEVLIERVGTTMPPDTPGSLASAEYARIVAYILQANGFAAGDVPLSGTRSNRGALPGLCRPAPPRRSEPRSS